MKHKQIIKLIDGVFDQENAKEIILTMIDKKIEFNEMNSFSKLVKQNITDSKLERRTKELKHAKQAIIEYFNAIKSAEFKLLAEIQIEAR
jgi:hypothetical protein